MSRSDRFHSPSASPGSPTVLITTGMSGDRPVGPLVSGTIETLVDGLRPR